MKYVCGICGWEYDEELGYPEDFEYPLCSVGKDPLSEA